MSTIDYFLLALAGVLFFILLRIRSKRKQKEAREREEVERVAERERARLRNEELKLSPVHGNKIMQARVRRVPAHEHPHRTFHHDCDDVSDGLMAAVVVDALMDTPEPPRTTRASPAMTAEYGISDTERARQNDYYSSAASSSSDFSSSSDSGYSSSSSDSGSSSSSFD